MNIEANLVISYTLYSRHIIYMRERLARYYRGKLVTLMKDFESPTIRMLNSQVTGTIFGPTKPKHTLYGTNVTMYFMFKGGADWEK